MKHVNPELISAFVDHELRGLQLRRVKRHLDQCPLCAAECRHLGHIRGMLRENHKPVEMDDPPEFFFHKVKSEIQARGQQTETVTMGRLSWRDWLYLHQGALASATSMAAVIAIGLAVFWFSQQMPFARRDDSGRRAHGLPLIHQVATFVPHAVATVLETPSTEESAVSVIWVSGLPWTDNMTELQTITTNPYYYLDI